MTHANRYILAIDVGNTRTKCGLLERSSDALPSCRNATVVGNGEEFPWQSISGWLDPLDPKSIPIIIAGSNPERIGQLSNNWLEEGPSRPQVIENCSDIPLDVNLPDPGQVGIDRLLNAVAANRVRPDDRPAIVIDCGTATTVDVVSTSGAFEGGAILPGLELTARALHQYTARLPLVDVAELSQSSPPVRGRNTQEAMQSGLFWGQVGAVRELVARLTEDLRDPMILITGGGGESLMPYLDEAQHETHLSLQGLALAVIDRN